MRILLALWCMNAMQCIHNNEDGLTRELFSKEDSILSLGRYRTGACNIKLFVPGRSLQPSLMFAGKDEAYPNEAPHVLQSRVGTWPHPQTLD
jgi:hypothetical protein